MNARRILPALLLLFVGSGCAALIYEIVWFQLLQLVIGSSAVSLGVLLGTFMGGMCLGSLLLPRCDLARGSIRCASTRCSRSGSPSSACSCCSACRCSAGSTSPGAASGVTGILLRGVAASICLLPPTLLMGATLPAIARWVETTPEGVSWLGFFYGGNIAGARARLPARRLLPAARARHAGRDVRRGRAEHDRRRRRARPSPGRRRIPRPSRRGARGDRARRRAPGLSTWRSPSRA